ncbi:hypothetical protein TNCV_3235931 [Trichonephila clavipes]|nr:hypothetical protein TNCV_3235931 [Trichonephila clavipes]
MFIERIADKCNGYNTLQNCIHQKQYMLDSIGGGIGVHVQICRLNSHMQKLWLFKQQDPHLRQGYSHQLDSSDVPMKSN